MTKRQYKKIQKRRGFKSYKRYRKYIWDMYWFTPIQPLFSFKHMIHTESLSDEELNDVKEVYNSMIEERTKIVDEFQRLFCVRHKRRRGHN